MAQVDVPRLTAAAAEVIEDVQAIIQHAQNHDLAVKDIVELVEDGWELGEAVAILVHLKKNPLAPKAVSNNLLSRLGRIATKKRALAELAPRVPRSTFEG